MFSILSRVTGFPLSSVWVPFGFPRKKWVPFINMHNVQVHDVTYCYNFGFLHTNKVSSCILIRYRFTTERGSSTMETIRLPGLARY